MKRFLIGIAATLAFGAAHAERDQIVIAADTSGCVVILKEKYGGIICDTGTVVMLFGNSVWITHRQKATSVYPNDNFAILSVDKLRR